LGNLKYVVPNGITAASMVVGMMSVAASVGGRYVDAAWCIMLCVLLDKADGTAARLLNASSRFGVELDSFSDFLTFGMAPAFLCFSLMTQDPRYMGFYADGTMYWIARIVPGFLVVCAGFRLAKFNVLTETIGSTMFLGVPTTLCGAFIASFMLTAWKYEFPDTVVGYFPLALFGLGLWMVSNLPLPKLQKTPSMAYNIFIVINVAIAYTLGVVRTLPEVLFVQAAVYLVVGTVFASMKMDVPNPRAEAA
jgi:CDP-diacylglycerol--serine O-phosphatidyltransferase